MGLWLVVTALVTGILFILGTGAILYYKVKMSYIAERAAKYAADLPLGTADLTTPTTNLATQMLADVGLPTNSAYVSVTPTTVGGVAGAQVTVGEGKLALPGNGTIIPPFVSLTETASAPRDSWIPEGMLVLSCRHTNNTPGGPNTAMAVPTYGRYTVNSGQLSTIAQQDTGTAYWPTTPNKWYYMSFPNGGWNSASSQWFDYPPEGGRGKAAPPADYPSTDLSK